MQRFILPAVVLAIVLGCVGLFIGDDFRCRNFGWGCPEINADDLIKQDGLYYEKFTHEPFSGKVKGQSAGLLWEGKQEGIWREYYKDGSLKEEFSCKDGKKHGSYTNWHENEYIWQEGTYKDGKKHGPYTSWHENGNKGWEGTYKDGKQHGLYTRWYENGNKGWEITYKRHRRLRTPNNLIPTPEGNCGGPCFRMRTEIKGGN